MEGKLRFCPLNTRVIREHRKRTGLFHWLKAHKNGEYRFIFLQETHSDVASENLWKKQLGANIYCSHGDLNAKEVAILCSKNGNFQLLKVDHDIDSRFCIIEVK